jgi:ParB-like chromosome segregation protein Spo0J
MSDAEAMFLALTENILREDLNDLDRSRYLLRLKRDLELTWGEIAKTLGLSEARVKQLAGLSSLPDALQESMREGHLAGSAAQRIAAIQDDAMREELIQKAREGRLTRREVIRRIAVSDESVKTKEGARSEPAKESAAAVRPTVIQRLFEFRRLVVSMNRLNEDEREEAEIIREHLNRLLG